MFVSKDDDGNKYSVIGNNSGGLGGGGPSRLNCLPDCHRLDYQQFCERRRIVYCGGVWDVR